MGNTSLHKARLSKNDEFYTQLETIEKEMVHYRDSLRDKIVFLNCNDSIDSSFFHYFSYSFHMLGLKKLIATTYEASTVNLFNLGQPQKMAKLIEYSGELDGSRVPKKESMKITVLDGDGDFRSAESVELLKQADIVVTNPPFSLFREHFGQLVEYNKEFLILGSINAIGYKNFFPMLKDDKVWPGSLFNEVVEFKLPKDANRYTRIDYKGDKFGSVPGITWWTNIEYPRSRPPMILFRRYERSKDLFPEYDNYNAIEVDKVINIPKDYNGFMGVPITFIGSYNPNQFEILGVMKKGEPSQGMTFTKDKKEIITLLDLIDGEEIETNMFTQPNQIVKGPSIDGVNKYVRLIIKRKNK